MIIVRKGSNWNMFEKLKAVIYYFFKEVKSSITKNLGMAVVTVITISLAMLTFELTLLTFLNFKYIEKRIFSHLKIHAYLKRDLSKEQIDELMKQINTIPGVVNVNFVSRDVVFKRAISELDIELNRESKYNPMPDILEIGVESPELIEPIALRVSAMKGVQDVEYWQRYLKRFSEFAKNLERILAILVSILLIASLFIVSNTIRLTMIAREREITIMYLIGAPLWYVKIPFIVEGLIHSLIGAVLAIMLVKLLYTKLYAWFSKNLVLINLMPPSGLNSINWITLGIGALIGIIGSYISLRAHLSQIASLEK